VLRSAVHRKDGKEFLQAALQFNIGPCVEHEGLVMWSYRGTRNSSKKDRAIPRRRLI
jgi:hypothetical protein